MLQHCLEIMNFMLGKFLKPEDFILHSPTDFSTPFLQEEKSRFLIFGHVPTFLLHNYDADAKPGKIFIKNNYIAIDCGAVFPMAVEWAVCV